MDHFAGLDVSVKETSLCIVDDAGGIIREVKVASEPEALLQPLKKPCFHFLIKIQGEAPCPNSAQQVMLREGVSHNAQAARPDR